MTAELHGKTRREDLLTSYVFDIIANHGILPAFEEWFATAQRVSTVGMPLKLAKPAKGRSHVAFWPSFGKYGIPDATIIVDDAGKRSLIGVEVKDGAGPGPGQLKRYAEALASSGLHLDTWRIRPRLKFFSRPDAKLSVLLYITRVLRVPKEDVKDCCHSQITIFALS